MTKRAPVGMAVCDDCDWTAKGSTRFHDAAAHRESTGHLTRASLSDTSGDDTGQRATAALHGAAHLMRY